MSNWFSNCFSASCLNNVSDGVSRYHRSSSQEVPRRLNQGEIDKKVENCGQQTLDSNSRPRPLHLNLSSETELSSPKATPRSIAFAGAKPLVVTNRFYEDSNEPVILIDNSESNTIIFANKRARSFFKNQNREAIDFLAYSIQDIIPDFKLPKKEAPIGKVPKEEVLDKEALAEALNKEVIKEKFYGEEVQTVNGRQLVVYSLNSALYAKDNRERPIWVLTVDEKYNPVDPHVMHTLKNLSNNQIEICRDISMPMDEKLRLLEVTARVISYFSSMSLSQTKVRDNVEITKNTYNFSLVKDSVMALKSSSMTEKAIKLNFEISDELREHEIIGPNENEIICIIDNLVGNAIKYGKKAKNANMENEHEIKEKEEKSAIEVTAKLVKANENSNALFVEVEVIDNGPGVPKNKQQGLFDDKREAAEHQQGGFQIGLPGCKKALNKLNPNKDNISYRDNPNGGGSIFSFRFPVVKGKKIQLKKEVEVNAQRQPVAPKAVVPVRQVAQTSNLLKGKRVMIADDTLLTRKALSKKIRETFEGVILSEAMSGEEAVKTYQASEEGGLTDVIFMDENMGGITGSVAAEKIIKIATEKGKNPPVIIGFSADNTEIYQEDCSRAGMKATVEKKILAKDLIDLFKKLEFTES